MKCRVCGQPATISLRAYNTALCTDHFIPFIEKRVFDTIRKYHLIETGEVPVVAVSGGKDSLSIWYILNKLGYPADGIYVDLGIDGYSDLSFSKIQAVADQLGRSVHVLRVRDALAKGIDDISRIVRRATCSTCGMIKRYAMNRICIEQGYTVLVTGHNMDDEAAALLGNVLYWKEEYLWKKGISLGGEEGHLSKKVKPLFLCSEKEIAAYAILSGIDYIYDECPFSRDAKSLLYKAVLNRIEDTSPATKIRFLKGYMTLASEQKVERVQGEARYCTTCGYPSFHATCNMCRLLGRFGFSGAAISFEEYTPPALTGRKEG